MFRMPVVGSSSVEHAGIMANPLISRTEMRTDFTVFIVTGFDAGVKI
jgi:hypothetical protein